MSGDVRPRRQGVEAPATAASEEEDSEKKATGCPRILPVAALLFLAATLIVLMRTGATPARARLRPAVEAAMQEEAQEIEEEAAASAAPVSSAAVAAAATPAPAPAPPEQEAPPPAPASWRRHQRQQQPGLPAGPEVPAPAPSGGAVHTVRCATTTGPIAVEVHEAWAPRGAERFLEMVRGGFFSSRVTLFRAVRGFICQTGVPGNPAVHRAWQQKGRIKDDPQWLEVKHHHGPMKRGYLSFAGGGKDSRGTEFFFSFRDINLGGSPWEVPFGTLVGTESFEAMDHWYTGYGDMKAFGGGAPEQHRMYLEGVQYVDRDFPEIDYITECSVATDQEG